MKSKLLIVVTIGLIMLISFIVFLISNQSTSNTKFSNDLCWNQVYTEGNQLNWPNSCSGSKDKTLVCLEMLTPLSEDAANQYNNWKKAGEPNISGCN